mmetsp:Transcript_63168/g.137341  ORF Transcript_63168/g.137341 Transcript_63168/m.137341 type:complete len:202 (-) Transcript_63168:498-1103(-)
MVLDLIANGCGKALGVQVSRRQCELRGGVYVGSALVPDAVHTWFHGGATSEFDREGLRVGRAHLRHGCLLILHQRDHKRHHEPVATNILPGKSIFPPPQVLARATYLARPRRTSEKVCHSCASGQDEGASAEGCDPSRPPVWSIEGRVGGRAARADLDPSSALPQASGEGQAADSRLVFQGPVGDVLLQRGCALQPLAGVV